MQPALPKVLVVDSNFVDEDGTPFVGASIFATHIRCHPNEKEKVVRGLAIAGIEAKIVYEQEGN